jgi:hypothetical protein
MSKPSTTKQSKKVSLTEESIRNRISRRSVNQRKASVNLGTAFPSPARRENYRQTLKRKNSFYNYISNNARMNKDAGDKEWKDAFKSRPRYSTRQKVKPTWLRPSSSWGSWST